jgi:hypothetical protein
MPSQALRRSTPADIVCNGAWIKIALRGVEVALNVVPRRAPPGHYF